MRFRKIVAFVVLNLIYTSKLIAAPCDENFTSSGNLIVGSTYKTFAELPNVSTEAAFQGAYADIAKEPSWKILSSDKANGALQAVQAASYAKGKTIPLNIVIEPISGGSKISLAYATPAGTLSPESAVKSQFCQTIASAVNGVASSQPSVASSLPAQATNTSNQNVNPSNKTQFGLALITPQQQAKINGELNKKLPQKNLQDKITEASSTIIPFLEKLSCLNDYSARSITYIHVVPGKHLSTETPMLFGRMQYHDKQQCMSVARVSGWKSPALNALQFDVLFLAEDSGETTTTHHEIVKQPDGLWLFTY